MMTILSFSSSSTDKVEEVLMFWDEEIVCTTLRSPSFLEVSDIPEGEVLCL